MSKETELDFGTGAKRVDLAITASFQVEALLTLLRRANDANNLMECMAIIGPKMADLLSMQVGALSDPLVTIGSMNATLGIKEASHV